MSQTVTVACRLPHGLMIEVVDPSVFQKDKDGNTIVVQRPIEEGARIRVNGNARPVGVPLPDDAPQVVSGFALTPGVPADLWDAWLDQNKAAPFVKAGLIFAHAKSGDTVAQAREGKKLRSGFEGLDPDEPAPGIKRDDKKG